MIPLQAFFASSIAMGIYDYQASVAETSEVEKILLYEKAIACVAHAASLLNGPKADQYWYNQHYLAKLYYNQGVVFFNLPDNCQCIRVSPMGEEELFADAIQQLRVKEQQRQQHETSEAFHLALAVSRFERALMCYEKSDLSKLSNVFYQTMCELEPNTILVRVASILCNLYFAVEAGGESTYGSDNLSGFPLIDDEKLQTLSDVLTQYHSVHSKNPNKEEINEIMRLIPELQRNAESLPERSGRSGSSSGSSTQGGGEQQKEGVVCLNQKHLQQYAL